MNSSEGYYQKTQWHTGDVIVQHKMMNIEDWIASATDELLLARTGYNINRVKNSWNSLGERLDYITTSINTIVEHGIDQTVSDLINVITEAQDAAQRADTAATLLDNMTVAAQSLPAGQQAQVLDWKKESGHYSLTLGLPVPSFSVQSTITTIDGTTPASVSVDNTELLQRKLTFSIPVPKFSVSASAVTSGSITPTATGTDLNTLNPKINFGIPVSTPQIGTVTTTSTGTIDTTNMVSLSDTNTLNPKINFNIPVQKIADVDYDQATPGSAGSFELVNGTQLNPTLHLTVPVQNISQVTATSLAAGSQPTASLEYLDTAHLNLRLNLGLPLAEPINILHTYSTVADLQANIVNDVPIGHYAIISNAATNEDNGKLYMRTDTSPYYRFITDLAAATPRFAMGTINVVNADQQSVATIDVTDPANPVLNLTIPAKPILNAVNTTVTAVGTQAYGNFAGTLDNLSLNLSVPAIPQFNQNVNITTSGSQATGSITGTADDLQLNLNLPISDQNSIAYLNTHPENNPSLIPFIFNDITELIKRGGSAVVKYDGVSQSTNISSVFDGSGTYWTVNPTGKTIIQFELTLHKTFSNNNIVYIDFGAAENRAKNITIEVINTDYNQDDWTQKFNTTDSPNAHIYTTIAHTPVGESDSSGGFNKIRFTFSNWTTSNLFKIAQIGIYSEDSLGARETLMSRGEDDPVFRNIRPNTTETYNLGSSELKWNNVYTKQINGISIPNSPSFTDTKNTAGATNSTDKLYLIGATEQSENPETYSQELVYIGTDGCLYSNGEKVLTTSSPISSTTGAIGIRDEIDTNGGIIRHVRAVNLENDTVSPNSLLEGYTAHNSEGQLITGRASGEGGSGGYAYITVNNIAPDANDNITITAADITGTFQASQIPALNANKITDGIFNETRIPGLNANKIVDGVISTSRLPLMTGASSSTHGAVGLVPQPIAGYENRLLSGAGVWVAPIAPTLNSNAPASAGGVYNALQNKQDNLQFDPTPRANSHNPVWSEGIYDALALKQDNLGFDNAPTENSQNILTSGTIYAALDNKQDSFDFDNTPIQYSTNAITSGAVYEALQSVSSGSITLDNTVTQNSQNGVKSSGIYAALALKLNTSAVENSPTQNSNNPISSGAVYTAMSTVMTGATSNLAGAIGVVPAPAQGYQNRLLSGAGTWIATIAPTENSNAPASAGEVYAALANKMPLMSVDQTVTQNSSALITSGAVYGALANASGVGIKVNNISPDANGNITITASNITGTFAASQIPNLNANKITNGTIAISRLPAFGGTNGITDGSAGIVPEPLSSDYGKVFSSDGSWQFIEDMITLDSTPTFGSTNLVNSTGIYNSLTTKVSKSGDTMTGDLILTNTSKIYFSSITNNVQDNYFRIQCLNRRFLIQEYIAGGNNSDGYNNYQLPIPDGDKKTYDILTTKDIVPIENGGTGSSTKNFVDLTTEQTVAGIKTFTSRPLVDISATKMEADTIASILSFKYQNPNEQVKTVNVIRTYGDSESSTANGIALIGSNSGTTVVTAGDATPTIIKNEGISNTENIYLIADGSIRFYVNGNTAANVINPIIVGSDGITVFHNQITLNNLTAEASWTPFIVGKIGGVKKYAIAYNNSSDVASCGIRVYSTDDTHYDVFYFPKQSSVTSNKSYDIITGKGGTVKGTIYGQISANLDITQAYSGLTSSENIFQVRTKDKNGTEIGIFRQIAYAGENNNGLIGWEFINRRNIVDESAGTSTLSSWKYFRFGLDKDGNIQYRVDGDAAFRNAINAVNKAGDTITGSLLIDSSDRYPSFSIVRRGTDTALFAMMLDYNNSSRWFRIRNSTTTYRDDYHFPQKGADETGDESYTILTTKTVNLANYVNITSAQTVAGVKTFTSAPVIDLSATATAAETSKTILSFKYQNPNEKVKTVNVIRTYGDSEDGTANGVAIIGSHNGPTVIGAGEGVINAIKLQLSNIGSTEQIALIADGAIQFFTNAGASSNDGTQTRKSMVITAAGNVEIPYGNISFNSGTNWKGIGLHGASGSPNLALLNTGTRLTIDQYKSGSTGGERFLLPIPDTHDSDVWYSILTTKETGAITTTSANDVSITSGTSWQTLLTFTLAAGTYIIKCYAGFANNSSGYRHLVVTTNGTTTLSRFTADYRTPNNGTVTTCQFTFFHKVTSSTTLYLSCRQNSGSTLTVNPGVQCIRIL